MSDIPSTSSEVNPEDVDVEEEVEEEAYETILEEGGDFEDDDDEDMNGVIDGVDVNEHLKTAMQNSMGREEIEDEDLVNAINKFMRNEYDYDQFMRVTGGQTLREELGTKRKSAPEADGGDDDVIEVEDDDEDAELMEDVEQSGSGGEKYDALPEEARYIMNQIMSGDSAPLPIQNLADALRQQLDRSVTPPTLKTVKNEIRDEMEVEETPVESTSEPSRDRGKSKRLDAMLGQANVLAARGNTTDAMEILREVIKQDHKHAVAYQQIATVYEQQGDRQKALQFGLLASHLDPKTPAEDWIHWGDQAKIFGMLEEAAICYDRAIHINNQNWKYYEKRIEMLDRLNLRPLAMRTRLAAAQLIDNQDLQVDFQWFHELIRTVAQYYITMNDEEKAIQALEAFVLRSREFGKNAEAQHETLVGMYMAKSSFQQAGMSILALCKGIQAVFQQSRDPACEISYTNGTYNCSPFPPSGTVTYLIDERIFPISMHCHLTICLFSLNEIDQSMGLEEKLLTRDIRLKLDENYVLEVARIYKNKGNARFAMQFLDQLAENPTYNYHASADYWYLKGTLHMIQKDDEKAMEAFTRVLSLQPDHIDNRIHLSTLQQKHGMFDRALDTLQDYDLENCSSMPDERLLARRSDVLFEAGDTEQFVRTARMMLAPHFYKIYTAPEVLRKRRPARGKLMCPALSNTLKTCALGVIKHTNWERLIKRLGATAEANGPAQPSSLTSTDLHDYCLKLVECLNKMEKHQDALIVCCYAFLHPTLFKADKTSTFQNLVYYCSIKARCWTLAFEYVRFFYTFALMAPAAPEDAALSDLLQKRLFNAMNYVFVNSQNVCYHRFIMRALVKAKDNHALQAISGNNSLITGTYRHAMGEYLRVWVHNKKNPLICLLLALTFTHMSCKKDLSSRHLIAIRGIAFMKKYSKLRTCQQEVYYNIARMFHQLAILPLAKHFYDKVLEVEPPSVYAFDDEGNEIVETALKYDLRKMAAHNLALIYRTSGNIFAARELYEKYLVV